MNGINCIETKAGDNPHLPTLYTTNGLPQYCYLGANPCNLTVGENRCPDTCWRKCCAGIPDMPTYDPSKEQPIPQNIPSSSSDRYVLTGCNSDRTGICVPYSSQAKNIEPDGETFQTYDECMYMAKNNTCLQTKPYSTELCPNNESCVAAFKNLGWSNDQIVAQCCSNSK
jgi:hypothetical protein